MHTSRPWDVLVVGGGNAGLCAAIAARQRGATVLLVEKAERRFRGGNSSLTMNFRFPHRSVDELLGLLEPEHQTVGAVGALRQCYRGYSEEEFFSDLVRTSDGLCDRELALALSKGAWPTIAWLRSLGHRWECKPTILPGSVPVRLEQGGRGLQERSFAAAERLGVQFCYECSLDELVVEHGRVVGARVEQAGDTRTISASAVVLACGGYQASPELRRRHLGPAWEHVALRGVPYNTGAGILAAERIGAMPHGDYGSCHATPQDSRLPEHMLPGSNDESQSNSRYCFNYGVTVNLHGERFIDEGQDLPNFVYAKLGAAIVAQPGQIAFQIFDAHTVGRLPRDYFRSRNVFRADSLAALASGLGIEVAGFLRTMAAFNASVPDLTVDLLRLDGVSTRDLHPPKSNWAARIAVAPFYACPVRAGITFAYGGLRIDTSAHVLDRRSAVIPGLFAAGEIVGGIFFRNYAGGSGLMSGAYFGRRAGTGAAEAALG